MRKTLFWGLALVATIVAGVRLFFFKKPCQASGGKAMTLTSKSFDNQSRLPIDYTCEGKNISPDLSWNNMPFGTQSLVLICDDPDAPSKTWVHWVIFNIPVTIKGLSAGVPTTAKLADDSLQGKNDFGKLGYGGACPPPGHGTHRYFFKLYALSSMLDLRSGTTKDAVEQAMQNKILGQAQLIGTYSR